MKQSYVGIDPGKEGAIFLIRHDGFVEAHHFPKIGKDIDIHRLWKIFQTLPDNTVACLESVHALFNTAAKTNFEFGGTFYMLQGLLVAKGIPFKLVRPKEWQKLMHHGIVPIKKNGKNDPKAMSLLSFKQHFPDVDARVSERAKKFHSGIVDAGLIAWYARKAWQE
jgi:hypothetical protein